MPAAIDLQPAPLHRLVDQVQELLRAKLWLQVSLGLLLGTMMGFVLGPELGPELGTGGRDGA